MDEELNGEQQAAGWLTCFGAAEKAGGGDACCVVDAKCHAGIQTRSFGCINTHYLHGKYVVLCGCLYLFLICWSCYTQGLREAVRSSMLHIF